MRGGPLAVHGLELCGHRCDGGDLVGEVEPEADGHEPAVADAGGVDACAVDAVGGMHAIDDGTQEPDVVDLCAASPLRGLHLAAVVPALLDALRKHDDPAACVGLPGELSARGAIEQLGGTATAVDGEYERHGLGLVVALGHDHAVCASASLVLEHVIAHRGAGCRGRCGTEGQAERGEGGDEREAGEAHAPSYPAAPFGFRGR